MKIVSQDFEIQTPRQQEHAHVERLRWIGSLAHIAHLREDSKPSAATSFKKHLGTQPRLDGSLHADPRYTNMRRAPNPL